MENKKIKLNVVKIISIILMILGFSAFLSGVICSSLNYAKIIEIPVYLTPILISLGGVVGVLGTLLLIFKSNDKNSSEYNITSVLDSCYSKYDTELNSSLITNPDVENIDFVSDFIQFEEKKIQVSQYLYNNSTFYEFHNIQTEKLKDKIIIKPENGEITYSESLEKQHMKFEKYTKNHIDIELNGDILYIVIKGCKYIQSAKDNINKKSLNYVYNSLDFPLYVISRLKLKAIKNN